MERPVDLSAQITPWLNRCLALAQSFPLQDAISEFEKLETRWQQPGCRVAVIGEPNRGKTYFINRLLGRSVLQDEVLHHTAVSTSIIAGSDEQMKVRFSEESEEVRPLQESSWQDLQATDKADNEPAVDTEVQVILNHPWLKEMDVELIDTPPVDDLNGQKVALVFDLLDQCDGVILVISGMFPWSMTEALLLQQEVMKRHIPCLVVVSYLDKINEGQRSSVLNYIYSQVTQISTDVPVLPSFPVTNDVSEDESLKAVRVELEAMIAKGDRRVWRSQQIALRTADNLNFLIKIGEVGLTAVQMNATEREQMLQQIQTAQRSANLQWERIRLELDQRRQRHEDNLQQNLFKEKTVLLETFGFDLRKTPDPKVWWEDDLPFHLSRQLTGIAYKAEDYVMAMLSRDFEWLQGEVLRVFNINMVGSPTSAGLEEVGGTKVKLQQLSLADLKKYRFLTRVGASAAFITGYLLLGPVGIATAITIPLIGEPLLDKNLEEQRQQIFQKLEPTIDKVINEYYGRVSERLQRLYNQLIEDTQSEQRSWESAKNSAFEQNDIEHDYDWQELIEQATDLREEILQAL